MASLPRTPPLPSIIESSGPLPRVNNDLVEMTTDETAATIAMPMPHLKKGQAMQATPPLAPRLDSATASIGVTGTSPMNLSSLQPPHQQPLAPVGPGGTQQVMIGRALDHLSPAMGPPPEPFQSAVVPSIPSSSGLARAYDDPSSSHSQPQGAPEALKSAHRPRAEAARRPRPESSVPAPMKGTRTMVLVLIMVGCVLAGFVLVALLLGMIKR